MNMNIVLNFTEILAHLSLNILAKSIHSGKMRKTHNHMSLMLTKKTLILLSFKILPFKFSFTCICSQTSKNI